LFTNIWVKYQVVSLDKRRRYWYWTRDNDRTNVSLCRFGKCTI